MLPTTIGASGPAGLAAVGPVPAAATAPEVPLPWTPPPPAAVPAETELALPAPLPLTLPDPEVPGAEGATPFCGTTETAPCCDCCCATPAGNGPPLTAARMSSWVSRLPPQALTAIAGRITSVHHHRDPTRPAILRRLLSECVF